MRDTWGGEWGANGGAGQAGVARGANRGVGEAEAGNTPAPTEAEAPGESRAWASQASGWEPSGGHCAKSVRRKGKHIIASYKGSRRLEANAGNSRGLRGEGLGRRVGAEAAFTLPFTHFHKICRRITLHHGHSTRKQGGAERNEGGAPGLNFQREQQVQNSEARGEV